MLLPVTFDEVVTEIQRFTDLPLDEIAQRVWMQALEPGWNVIQDAAFFGITPFVYDARMERLYTEGDGFIFDSLVFWARSARRLWIEHTAARLRRYAERHAIAPEDMAILMFGDGPGSDSLYLAEQGFHIDFFEVPGSRTYDFAVRRFEHYGYLNNRIRPLADYATLLHGQYDAIVSFEVLEHLPDPVQAIADMNAILKLHGLAIVTDDFGDILGHLPTHLRSTAHYRGRTPFLFARHGMALTWYSPDELFKPYEFEKQGTAPINSRWALLRDYHIRSLYLSVYADRMARFISKLPYFRLRR